MSLFLFKLQSYQFRQVELICYWLILFRAIHLLWFRDFLDHDSRDRLVPGVGVKTFSESWTITNRHSHSNGSRSNPLAVSSDLTACERWCLFYHDLPKWRQYLRWELV